MEPVLGQVLAHKNTVSNKFNFKLNDLHTVKLNRENTEQLFILYVFFSLSPFLLVKSYIKHHYSTYGDTELKH